MWTKVKMTTLPVEETKSPKVDLHLEKTWTVQYSTVQCSAVQCSAVQYSTVQYSTVRCSAVQCSTVRFSTVRYNAVQYNTVHHGCEKRQANVCLVTLTRRHTRQEGKDVTGEGWRQTPLAGRATEPGAHNLPTLENTRQTHCTPCGRTLAFLLGCVEVELLHRF